MIISEFGYGFHYAPKFSPFLQKLIRSCLYHLAGLLATPVLRLICKINQPIWHNVDLILHDDKNSQLSRTYGAGVH